MSSYILSVDAEFDLDDIWEYIAADNIDAADSWIEKLFDAFEALGQTPGMGHPRVCFWWSASRLKGGCSQDWLPHKIASATGF